jgi:hypothetical protein
MTGAWQQLFSQDVCCWDETGALQTLAEFLEPLPLQRLVLADGSGKPLAAWSAQVPSSMNEVERLAAEAARRLEGRAWCTFSRRGTPRLAFAMRIARQSADVLLAGQIRRVPHASRLLRSRRQALHVAGKLACAVIEMQARHQRLRAQVRQLVAETETLRVSQAEAVAAALAACERRLRETLGTRSEK